jgi:hypothetical protein
MTRKQVSFGVLIGALVCALILSPILRVRFLESAFNKLKVNDSRESVLKRVGRPWREDGCGVFLGGKPPGCAEEFVYANPFAPYVPEYWIVSFDMNGRVIDLYYTTSP